MGKKAWEAESRHDGSQGIGDGPKAELREMQSGHRQNPAGATGMGKCRGQSRELSRSKSYRVSDHHPGEPRMPAGVEMIPPPSP